MSKQELVNWFEVNYWELPYYTKKLLMEQTYEQVCKKLGEWCAWRDIVKVMYQ